MRNRILAVAAGVLALGSGAASATTFAVNDLADAVDIAPGNGVCASARGTCTLRAAVQETNALPGADQITLAIGVHELSIRGTGEDVAATGDLDVTGDLTIAGANAYLSVIDANAIDRVIDHAPSGPSHSLTLRDLTLTGGDVAWGGGGLRYRQEVHGERIIVMRNTAGSGGGIGATDDGQPSLDLSTSIVSLNSATDGGGIDARHSFASVVELSIIIANSAVNHGGGANVLGSIGGGPILFDRVTVYGNNVTGGVAPCGGGIYAEAALELAQSNVGHNLVGAWGTAAPDDDGRGGGVYQSAGPGSIVNTTVEGNFAAAAGALATEGHLDITHVTVARNAVGRDGALHAYGKGNFYPVNTIIGENLPRNCAVGTLPIWSSDVAREYNLETSNNTCFLDTYILASKLDELGDYGGPTRSIPPLPGSYPIEHGIDAGVDIDQRGVARPQLAQFDLGAVEMQERSAHKKYTGDLTSNPHPCDLDRNGRVDFADLDQLIASFRVRGGNFLGKADQRLKQGVASCTHAGCPAVALIKKPAGQGQRRRDMAPSA